MAYDADLAAAVRDLLSDRPGITEKSMFGGLAFLSHGRMAVAVSTRAVLMVRVDPDEAAELVLEPGVGYVVMRGREMRGWLDVETAGPEDAGLGRWVERGVAAAGAADG